LAVTRKQTQGSQESLNITRRKFLRAFGGTVLGAAAMGAGGWTYATKIEPNWFDVVPVELHLPRLDPAFSGFRLVQISDIHASEAMTAAQVAEACQMVLALKPDLVAITGDFVDARDGAQAALKGLRSVLSALSEQVQVVGVLGNHDYYAGAESVRQMMRTAQITDLTNGVLTLERSGSMLHFAGLDDIWRGEPDLQKVLQQTPDSGAAVILVHEPDYARTTSAAGRFDLQISGHSHGGQVALPLLGPLVLPHLGKEFPSGLYQVGEMFQYTNRGLGTSYIRVRFNCRPEITAFTLRSP